MQGYTQYKGIVMLTLCSFIWGTAFIAQSVGGQYLEPLTFNCARSVLAAFSLFLCFVVFDRLAGKPFSFWGTQDKAVRRKLLHGGIVCGLALTVASLFQQWGIMHTTVGKSGFITSLYIVIIPLLERFVFSRTVNILNWLGVILAAIGLYFICINESFSINFGDLMILVCAFCFAIHILCVENVVQGLDGVRLSFLQFAVCALISGILMFLFENPKWENLFFAWNAVCYAGIMSSGVAYTLQILGQRHINAVLASMLMSLESVFAVLSGWLMLGQVLSLREIFGCVLVFAAIILSQLPVAIFKRHKKF